MTLRDENQPGASQEAEPEDPATKAATDHAFAKRRDGASRAAALGVMTAAGIDQERANAKIDLYDEMVGIMHHVRPHDVSAKVGARLDELGVQPGAGQLTKAPEVLMREATSMAASGNSKARVVEYLTSNGVTKPEAEQVATKLAGDVAAARQKFDSSKRSAGNRAWVSLGLGVLLLIVGLALMGSGAESSGRRSPLGAVLGGVAMIGFAIKDLASVGGQTFEGRAREVLR